MNWKIKLNIFFMLEVFQYCFVETLKSKQSNSDDNINSRVGFVSCNTDNLDLDVYSIFWPTFNISISNFSQNQKKRNLQIHLSCHSSDHVENQFTVVPNSFGRTYMSMLSSQNISWVLIGNVHKHRPGKSRSRTKKEVLVLQCNITGNPKPQNYSWLVNHLQIPPQRSIKFKHNRIAIKDSSKFANNLFTCCVTNLHDNASLCTPNSRGYTLKKKPILVHPPSDVIVKKGSSAFFNCSYQTSPSLEIIWTKKDSNKHLSNRSSHALCDRRCIYPNGTMALFDVNHGESYECFAKIGNFESEKRSAELKLADISEFGDTGSETKLVQLDQKFEFLCSTPSGFPEPNITWIRLSDNLTIREEGNHVTRIENTLVIDNVRIGDNVTYMCVASNIAGSVTMNVSVVIKELPRFVKNLLSEQVKEGSSFNWSCPVFGVPSPKIRWFKDGVEIQSRFNKTQFNGLDLILQNIEPVDAGTYTCRFSNYDDQTDRDSTPANLTVIEIPLFKRLDDVCIAAGDVVNVDCFVTRDGIKNLSWIKLNDSLSFRAIQHRSGKKLSLHFNKCSLKDAGLYRCVANPSAFSNIINISVVSLPQITHITRELTSYPGSTVVFNCEQTLDGRASVNWKRSLGSLTSRHTIHPNGSLVVNNIEFGDSDTYTCIYVICKFQAIADAKLKVVEATVPSTPIVVDNQSNHVILLLSIFGGIAYAFIFAACIVFYCRRRHRKKVAYESTPCENEKMLDGSSFDEKPLDNTMDEITSVDSYKQRSEMPVIDSDIKLYDYPVQNICPVTVIGKGKFGDVFLSKAPGLFPDLEDDILVMVKSFDSPLDDETRGKRVTPLRIEFYNEINLLHQSDHENIVKLLAVSSDSDMLNPIDYLVTEYLEWGILKLCLQASKNKNILNFTKQHKMLMCCQLACALEHLEAIGLCHNDVATRNCVISSHLLVKLSVLGLNNEGFENEYSNYEGRHLPIRWMAPEAVLKGVCSSKTDVWSYAVTCWEIFTLAQTPFAELTDQQVIEGLKTSPPALLPPIESSKRINSLIKKCCQIFPEDRPCMRQISKKLQSILGSGEVPSDEATEHSGKITDDQTDFTDEKRSDCEKTKIKIINQQK